MRRILFAFVFCVTAAMAMAQASRVFMTLPDSLCPFFSPQQRITLLRLAQVGATDSVDNLFSGKSVITSLSDTRLTLSVADGVEYLLALKADTILLVNTVCAPVCSSVVRSYVANWLPLGTVPPPAGMAFPQADIAADGTLVWTDRTPQLLDEEEKKHYRP